MCLESRPRNGTEATAFTISSNLAFSGSRKLYALVFMVMMGKITRAEELYAGYDIWRTWDLYWYFFYL